MDRNDEQAIAALFEKLSAVGQQYPSRDADAERYIQGRIADQPAAPYYMAQTIVTQEQALQNAQQKIAELEYQLSQKSAAAAPRGLFGSLFGGGRPSEMPAPSQMHPAQPRPAPQGHPGAFQTQPARGGGGFLAGAAQTAVGVAGGMMLGSALGSMFGGDEAQAAEPAPEPEAEPMVDEPAAEEEGGFFDDFEW